MFLYPSLPPSAPGWENDPAPSVQGTEAPAPGHLLADISEQVVIGQGKAAHLFSQLQSPLGIEREKQHFKGQH